SLRIDSYVHGLCGWLSYFFFSSRRRHTRFSRDWSSDVCSSDLRPVGGRDGGGGGGLRQAVALEDVDARARVEGAEAAAERGAPADGVADPAAHGVAQLAVDQQIGRASCRERV